MSYLDNDQQQMQALIDAINRQAAAQERANELAADQLGRSKPDGETTAPRPRKPLEQFSEGERQKRLDKAAMAVIERFWASNKGYFSRSALKYDLRKAGLSDRYTKGLAERVSILDSQIRVSGDSWLIQRDQELEQLLGKTTQEAAGRITELLTNDWQDVRSLRAVMEAIVQRDDGTFDSRRFYNALAVVRDNPDTEFRRDGSRGEELRLKP